MAKEPQKNPGENGGSSKKVVNDREAHEEMEVGTHLEKVLSPVLHETPPAPSWPENLQELGPTEYSFKGCLPRVIVLGRF